MVTPQQLGSQKISAHANIAWESHMGETTRGLGNHYAPHGDLDVRDARGQATTQKRATSVPTVHRGATTQRSVRLATGTEFRRKNFMSWETLCWQP